MMKGKTETTQNVTNFKSNQLSYYYRNKDTINQQRRNTYRNNKTINSNNQSTNQLITSNNQKSCNILEENFSKKTGCIDLQTSEKKPILSLFTLVDRAYRHTHGKSKDTPNTHSKTTFSFYPKYMQVEPLLQEIMLYMAIYKSTSFGYSEFTTTFIHVNKFKLKREIQRLINLKWILRYGRGDLAFYVINPFLEHLLEMNYKNYRWLLEYAPYKIDFFDVLNIPLISFLKSGQKAKKIEITPHKTRIGQIKTIFNYGYVTIRIHSETGEIYQTYLPVNLHGQPIFSGKKDKELFKHLCVPLSWELFDIQDCKYYSGYDKELDKTVYVHFDNSISLLHNKSKFYFGYEQWTNALEKWQGYQYLEFRDFKTLKELFTARFVKGKRRKDLFEAMGLELKTMQRDNKTIRKYLRKERMSKLEPVNNDEWEKKEALI